MRSDQHLLTLAQVPFRLVWLGCNEIEGFHWLRWLWVKTNGTIVG